MNLNKSQDNGVLCRKSDELSDAERCMDKEDEAKEGHKGD
jgi:hypothetical protein